MDKSPTVAEIDEALMWLRMSFYRHDGDQVKQSFILSCIDSLLEQRQSALVG